eukprot:5054255-Amphidinium_carterae.1
MTSQLKSPRSYGLATSWNFDAAERGLDFLHMCGFVAEVASSMAGLATKSCEAFECCAIDITRMV